MCAQIAVCPIALERRVAERPVNWMVLDEAIDTQPGMVRVARPSVVSRFGHKSVAHRRMIDDLAREQEVPLGLDHRCPVAATPYRSAASMAPVEGLNIPAADGPHRMW